MHMFPVVTGTQEYQDATKEFEDTVKPHYNVTIVEVKRVQNRNEYAKHIALEQAINRKHGKPVVPKRLFHGSKQESLELIAVQGFNRNFAADANGMYYIIHVVFITILPSLQSHSMGHKAIIMYYIVSSFFFITAAYFGKGVYFAVNAWYSAQPKYSAPDKDGNQHMFVCRVLVGEYTVGKAHMKVAPPLHPGSKDVFDSLVDNVQAPTIFVAMTDAQVYPEYLITFKVKK